MHDKKIRNVDRLQLIEYTVKVNWWNNYVTNSHTNNFLFYSNSHFSIVFTFIMCHIQILYVWFWITIWRSVVCLFYCNSPNISVILRVWKKCVTYLNWFCHRSVNKLYSINKLSLDIKIYSIGVTIIDKFLIRSGLDERKWLVIS